MAYNRLQNNTRCEEITSNQDEMGWACNTQGDKRNSYGVLVRKPEVKRQDLRERVIDERLILKWTLDKSCGRL
jgi:hypothetical protein